jgi:outer membrane protein assembly factor BamB
MFRTIRRSILALSLAACAALAGEAPAPGPKVVAFQGGGALLGVAEDLKVDLDDKPHPTAPFKVRWQVKTDDADRVNVEGSPLIAGDVVYLADERGTLHALNLADGKPKWRYSAGKDSGFATTPLFVDGRVYAGDMLGVFHCVDAATGKQVWTVDTESPIHASANAAGERIIFGNDGAAVYCLNAADGKVLWKGQSGDKIYSTPAIGNGLCFISGCDAQLRAFEVETGKERFAVDLGGIAAGSAILPEGQIVVPTDGGKVISFSPDGQKTNWSYEQVKESAMVYATPAIHDGVIVVGARDRQVHGIDAKTGEQKWTFKTRGDNDAPALISGGRAYVTSKDKKLYVLDVKTGTMLYQFAATRMIDGGPAIGSGVVVFADSNGNIFCLEPVK